MHVLAAWEVSGLLLLLGRGALTPCIQICLDRPDAFSGLVVDGREKLPSPSLSAIMRPFTRCCNKEVPTISSLEIAVCQTGG